jgi:hypothetical protein
MNFLGRVLELEELLALEEQKSQKLAILLKTQQTPRRAISLLYMMN